MVSTVDWADDMSSKFQTDVYTTEDITTSAEWNSRASTSLVPFKTALLFFGVLGTLTNGFLLVGFWLSDRSKMTSSSVYIVNHTTLDQSDNYVTLTYMYMHRPTLI